MLYTFNDSSERIYFADFDTIEQARNFAYHCGLCFEGRATEGAKQSKIFTLVDDAIKREEARKL